MFSLITVMANIVTNVRSTPCCVLFFCLTILLRGAVALQQVYWCNFEAFTTCNLSTDEKETPYRWTLKDNMVSFLRSGPEADRTPGEDSDRYMYSLSRSDIKNGPIASTMSTTDLTLPAGEGMLSFYYCFWGPGKHGSRLSVQIQCGDEGATEIWRNKSNGQKTVWTKGSAQVKCETSFKLMFNSAHTTNDSNVALDDIVLEGMDVPCVRASSAATPTNGDKPLNTMTMEGVREQPRQDAMLLSAVLFFFALVFLIVSITVNCYAWSKRKNRSVRLRSHQLSIHNSGYDCPVHTTTTGDAEDNGSTNMKELHLALEGVRDNRQLSLPVATTRSSGEAANKGPLATLVPFFDRVRSKTMPTKRSFDCYESIDTGEAPSPSRSEKRGLSDEGGMRKKGFAGKKSQFSRSNSLPSNSPRNDVYESIDKYHNKGTGKPLPYEITDLIGETYNTDDLINQCRDNVSSNSSIPSCTRLQPPSVYDNLDRKSPLLQPRHTQIPFFHSPSTSQCDVTSLSSYDTVAPTCPIVSHDDASPSSSFKGTHGEDVYNSLNHRRPSNLSNPTRDATISDETAVVSDEYQVPKGVDTNRSIRPKLAEPHGFHGSYWPSDLQDRSPETTGYQPLITPESRTNNVSESEGKRCEPSSNIYHTLDPDALSEQSFERSSSQEASHDTLVPAMNDNSTHHMNTDSSHDYEDFD